MLAGCPILASLVLEAPRFGWLGGAALLVGVAAVVFMYTLGLRGREHSPVVRLALLALRLGAVLCLLVALVHPTWIRQTTGTIRPVVAVVLDDSLSMSQPAEAKASVTRYARAVEVLRDRLGPALAATHDVRCFDVQGRAVALGSLPAQPQGDRSPLSATLLQLQQDFQGQPLAGIVLLSDGAECTDRPTTGSLEQLRVPVHAIDVAGATAAGDGPLDLFVQAVNANRRALVGNTVKVTVDLGLEGKSATPGAPGTPGGPGDLTVPVAILAGDRPVVARTIKWREGEPSTRVELEFAPRQAGKFTYSVQAGPLAGEANLANNRATFALTVRAKALTVLYIDGVLRWEGKFIREALAADPDVNVISAVRTAPPGAGRGSQGILLPEQLANVDVVILGDVEATYFSAQELVALKKWVTDSGGGLVLTGGYRSFGHEGFGRTDLRDVLPVEFSAAANPQIEQPFGFKLTDAGREHPIFHLTGDALRDAAFYQALPQLAGCSRIAGVKPGAEVLAVNAQASVVEGQTGGASGGGGGGGLPIMVAQQVGLGRALVLAVDTTWRWRMVVGGFTGDASFYQRFWGQLVRWMASSDDDTPQQLVVSTDRYRYQMGQTIEVIAQFKDPQAEARREARGAATAPAPGARPGAAPAALRPAPFAPDQWKLTAYALDEAGHRIPVALAYVDGRKYRGTLGAPAPGKLDLVVFAEPAKLGAVPLNTIGPHSVEPMAQSQVVSVQVDRPDLESFATRPDPQFLARAAQLSGGQFLKPAQIDTWAGQLPHQPITITHVQATGLWRHPILVTLFFLLLCSEWVIRRWSRLA